MQLSENQIRYHVSKCVDSVVISTSDRHANMLLSQDRVDMTFGVMKVRARSF